MTFLGSLAILAGIAFGSILVGRLFVGALGSGLLRRFTPTTAAASAILGTAVAVILFGWLTLAGVPAPGIGFALAVASIALLALTRWRGALDVLRPRGRPVIWLAPAVAVLAVASLALLPVLVSGDFNVGNDTYIYCAMAEWLQGTGLGTPMGAERLFSPVTFFPRVYQERPLRLGATYVLALVHAACRAPSPLSVYPAVSTWGVLLELAGILLVVRWVFRFPRAWAMGAAFAFGALSHPGYWSHHNGFLSQPYGLAGLLAGVALLSRSAHERHWHGSTAILVALIGAFLLSVYLPLFPALGAAGACWAGASLVRARHRRRVPSCLLLLAGTAVAFCLVAQRDLVVLVHGLPVLASAGVGGHVPFGSWDRIALAMGVLWFPEGGLDELPRGLVSFATVVVGGLAIVGGARTAKQPRSRTLHATFLSLAGALAYYSLLVADPWTREPGHTWNVFKLLQWMHPMLLLYQVAGAFHLARRGKVAQALISGTSLLLVAGLGSQHGAWSRPGWGSLQHVAQVSRPLEGIPRFREALRKLPAGTLVLAGRPSDRDPWLGPFFALLAYPRPLITDWEGSAWMGPSSDQRETSESRDSRSDNLIPITCQPLEAVARPLEELGWGCSSVATEEPLVVRVSGRRQLLKRTGPLHLLLFSPYEVEGELVFSVESSAAPATSMTALVNGEIGVEIQTGQASEWCLSLRMRPGLTSVELRPNSAEGPGAKIGAVRFAPAAYPAPR